MSISKVFLAGDPEPLFLSGHPDVVAAELAASPPDEFMRCEMAPYTRDEHGRPAYIKPGAVTAVLPLHPKELEYHMDTPPHWLGDD